jgi:hypothetical protein
MLQSLSVRDHVCTFSVDSITHVENKQKCGPFMSQEVVWRRIDVVSAVCCDTIGMCEGVAEQAYRPFPPFPFAFVLGVQHLTFFIFPFCSTSDVLCSRLM